MDSLPPGHHPDWRTSVLLLIWGTASPEDFLGIGGSCLPRYAGAPREHGLAMLGAPGGLCWTGSPSTHQWAYPAHTRGSFRFTTKGTKGVPGALPLDPVGGLLSSPQRRQAPLPSRKGCLFGWHASHKPPAAPRIDSRKCSLDRTKGKNKTDLPTQLKVANRSIFVAQTLSRGLRAPQGERERKVFHFSLGPPQGSTQRGCPPLGDSLVTFSSGRKSPGVEGRSALLSGAVGAKGPHLGSAEGRSPA